MNLKKLSPLIIIILTVSFFSCLPDEYDDNEGSYGIRHDRLLSEYEDLAASYTGDQPDFSCVAFFSYSLNGSPDHEFVASGTLIAPEWILTAGHNFYDAFEQAFPAPPGGVQVSFGNDPNVVQEYYDVAEIILHPSWLEGYQYYEAANDLCLVRLSSPVNDITPAKLHVSGSETVGSKTWFCGFGDYSQTWGEDPDLFSKKHAMENILDRKIGGLMTETGGVTYRGGLLAFDFDDPDGLINSLGDDILNADEKILGDGNSEPYALDFEGTTIEGDSGGPLFIKNANNWELAGVLSGGAVEPIPGHEDGSYGDISIFMRVSQSHDWIQSVIK